MLQALGLMKAEHPSTEGQAHSQGGRRSLLTGLVPPHHALTPEPATNACAQM